MRLAQLSRKVKAKPSDIQIFLKDKFGIAADDVNTRINQEQIDAVLLKFGPRNETAQLSMDYGLFAESAPDETDVDLREEAAQEIVQDTLPEEEASPIVTADTEPATIDVVDLEKQAVVASDATHIEPDSELIIEDGVIKAPRIKLEGLKVVGKIELPAKKVKEIQVVQPVEQADAATDNAVTQVESPVVSSTPAASEDAVLAELEQQMARNKQAVKASRQKSQTPKEVEEHFAADDESSAYKDSKGIYHFTLTQLENRKKALLRIAEKKKNKSQKKSKVSHYEKRMNETKSVTKKAEPAKKSQPKKIKREEEAKPKAKGPLAKFLRWLND